jgi:formate dehydrogenase major subunit
MLLTRKATGQAVAQGRLARSAVPGKTIDRRTFLKRSGITVGAGAVASQLPFSMIGEAEAKNEAEGKMEV